MKGGPSFTKPQNYLDIGSELTLTVCHFFTDLFNSVDKHLYCTLKNKTQSGKKCQTSLMMFRCERISKNSLKMQEEMRYPYSLRSYN